MSEEDVVEYSVIISDDAELDLLETAGYIQKQSPQNAVAWLMGARRMMQSLSKLPYRFGDAREASPQRPGLLQAIFHSHRIIYSVDESRRVVFIHRVVHSAQDRWR